ncbi:MerR family transcriptional regulator [Paenibacillus sp. CAU 1523]|uniref:MerR family transcriptional regulator n=1 Tax=Paenibacillus arenosi TaxID=2774142 RepID=A0ABR9ASE3_9BACL|nr:MerR family transcriptional regulator [Paenibacillus arenosi]
MGATVPYTVQDVAEISGVSVRTLRYYDQIDLLKPAYYGDNGYRYYEQEQLIKLQHILFFRELDLPLADIHEMIKRDTFNQAEALQHHRQLLLSKVNRLHTLIKTLDRTIANLRGECDLTEQQRFAGFDNGKQNRYVKELKERYDKAGQLTMHASTDSISIQDNGLHDERLACLIAQLLEAGIQPEDEQVQRLIGHHYAWVSHMYLTTPEGYAKLADLYVNEEQFRSYYDLIHPQLAHFLRQAMLIFITQHQQNI